MPNENGFVLVGALLILVLLTLIGISATTSAVLELQISGADRIHSETFFQADAGVQLAARLIEENLAARDKGGFSALEGAVLRDPALGGTGLENRTLVIDQAELWANQGSLGQAPDPSVNRDIGYYPGGFDPAAGDAAPHTDIAVAGWTDTVSGSGGGGFGAGYEPAGALPSEQIIYTIHSRHTGRSGSAALIEARWRHMNGQELPARL